MRLLSLFLLLAISFGCSAVCTPTHHYGPVLAVDPSFSDDEIEDFMRAADEWCRAADTPRACVRLLGVNDTTPDWDSFGKQPRLIRASLDTNLAMMAVLTFGPFIAGIQRWNAIALFPHAIVDRHDWVQTSVHEIGHLLGLDHEDGGAMGTTLTCIPQDSLDVLCDLIECGPYAAPTCIEPR